MIEHDYIDVNSDSDANDEMDSPQSHGTPSNSTRSKLVSEEATPQCTTKPDNNLVASTMQMPNPSDTGLSNAINEILDLLEKVKERHFPARCSGPSFDDLRDAIVEFYNLAKDADNDSRANLRLLTERLQCAQLTRKEALTGLALKDDVRTLRDDLSKLTKTLTTDDNSVPSSLRNDFKALREAVIESLCTSRQDSRDLKTHISALKGQCSEDDDENHATLDLLADELDTFRYELAMLRRDITSVRVPGALEDVSISKDVDALYMSVNALARKYGKNTVGCHDIIAPTLTDIPTLRNQIRILRGAASSIYDFLLRNEKNMHQRVPELERNLVLKIDIRATQVALKEIRDRINNGPSPPLHHNFLEHDAAMAETEIAALGREIVSLRHKGYRETDGKTLSLLGLFDHEDSKKSKILELCKIDPEFKNKLKACVSEETQGLPAAQQDEGEAAKDENNVSGGDKEFAGPEQIGANNNEIKPEQDVSDSEALETEQFNLKGYLSLFERVLEAKAAQ